jgi:hypothetical protein
MKMKKNLLFGLMAVVAILFSSCEDYGYQTEIIDFEDVQLDSTGIYNGSDLSGTQFETGYYIKNIPSGAIELINEYSVSDWGGFLFESWNGFAVSSKIDSVTSGYDNQYSVKAGKGALGSNQFALAFDTARLIVFHPQSKTVIQNGKVKSIMLANSTYAYNDMRDGSAFGKKFTDGDWFKVIITGYMGTSVVGTVDYYLADFRSGKKFLNKDWVKVDISKLGEVSALGFSFDSSDKGAWGVNTPKYVCVDNLTVAYKEISE